MHKAIAIGLLAAVTAACGEARSESGGPTVDRAYQVGEFQKIEVAGAYEVDVRTGGGPTVAARGPEKGIERLVVEVKGDTLMIYPRKERGMNFGWSSDEPVQLTVTVPALRGASITGSGGMRIDRVRGDSFEGEIGGSGDLEVGIIEVQTLSLGIAGSGEARAGAGRAREAQYEIAGSGDIQAGKVNADTARVSIAGSGNVAAHATKTAAVEIAGSGDVELSGGAKCTVDKVGSGDVRCT